MRQLLSFSGRASRAEWWMAFVAILTVFIVGLLINWGILAFQLGLATDPSVSDATINVVLVIRRVIQTILTLVAPLWILLATSSRRWHDRGKAGHWSWLLVLAIVGWIVFISNWDDFVGPISGFLNVVHVVPVVALAWFTVELGFVEGMQKPNRFGFLAVSQNLPDDGDD